MGGRRDEGVGQPDALAVALREVADALVGDVEHAGLVHGVVDPRARGRARTRLSSARKRRYSTTRISG